MSASSGRLRRMTDYFSLVAQVAATLLVAYVVLVGPRRNDDRIARVIEVLSAAFMACALVSALAFALPRSDYSKDSVNAGYLFLTVLLSALLMVVAAFVRPVRAARGFWFRPPKPAKSNVDAPSTGPSGCPATGHRRPRSRAGRFSHRAAAQR
jgi:hypothetical protein